MVHVADGHPVAVHDDDPVVLGHPEHVQLLVAAAVVVVSQLLRGAVEAPKDAALALPRLEHQTRPVGVDRVGHVLERFRRVDQDVVDFQLQQVSYDDLQSWIDCLVD